AILARRPACGHAATINEHPNSSFNAVTVTGPIDKACATEAIDNTRLTANATRAMRSTHPVTRTATASANAANRAENHHGIGDTLTNNVRPFTSAATRGVVAPRMIVATLVEPSPNLVSNQDLTVLHAIGARVAFAKSRGPIGRPFQRPSAQVLLAPCAADREVLHVHSIIFDDLRPYDWISQQETKRA